MTPQLISLRRWSLSLMAMVWAGLLSGCPAPHQCTQNADCPGSQTCKANTEGQRTCVGPLPSLSCTNDADCTNAPKAICNTVSGKCEAKRTGECTSDADCNAVRPRCNSTTGQCEAVGPCGCASDADCPTGLTCQEVGGGTRVCLAP